MSTLGRHCVPVCWPGRGQHELVSQSLLSPDDCTSLPHQAAQGSVPNPQSWGWVPQGVLSSSPALLQQHPRSTCGPTCRAGGGGRGGLQARPAHLARPDALQEAAVWGAPPIHIHLAPVLAIGDRWLCRASRPRPQLCHWALHPWEEGTPKQGPCSAAEEGAPASWSMSVSARRRGSACCTLQ